MTENEQFPKIYYCEEKNAFCLTDSCVKGKELLHYPESSRDEYEDPYYMGYGKRFIPGEITTHIKFKDGTEKYIDGKIGFLKGCDNSD